MGRQPAFDHDAVLDRAVAAFWKSGYEGTSIADLVTATGLGRGSLYAAFGDKRGLFEAALERYASVVSARTFQPLDEPEAGFEVIEVVFERLATPDLGAPAPGCLFTNTACELGPGDAKLGARVKLAFDGLERRLLVVLARAARRGQLRAHLSVTDAAVFLVGVAQGLRVLARLGEPPAKLQTVAATALASLRASPTQTGRI